MLRPLPGERPGSAPVSELTFGKKLLTPFLSGLIR